MLIRNSDYEPVFLIPVDGKPAGLEQEKYCKLLVCGTLSHRKCEGKAGPTTLRVIGKKLLIKR